MGTSTPRSDDPRAPVQRHGNYLVLIVTLVMAAAAIYGYSYVKMSKTSPAEAEAKAPITQATPVTQD